MKIIELTEEYKKKWDDYLKSNLYSSIFHTLEWKQIIQDVFNFKPLYFLALDESSKVKGILCSFFIKSLIFGKKITSCPFNYFNSPLFDDYEAGKTLINHTIKSGKEKEVKYVELKFTKAIEDKLANELNLIKRVHYCCSKIELNSDFEKVKLRYGMNLKKNLKRILNKASRNNIKVREIKGKSELKEIYNILVKEYRNKHLMIVQPYKLFLKFYDVLTNNDMMKILVARKDKRIIAGIILLFFKDQVEYIYGCSDSEYNEYQPSIILMNESIKLSCSLNYKSFNMGITSPYQEKLLYFKSKWGSTTEKMPYYYYLIKSKEIPELDYYTSYATVRRLFKYVPISVIKMTSLLITKQLG